MSTELVLSRDLVNPFMEMQKQRLELEKKQKDLISGIHHHCFRKIPENIYEIGTEHFEVIAVNLVSFKLLIKSFNIKIETTVQGGSKRRMEYTIEELDIDSFINATNYEEITRENFYTTEIVYTKMCDLYYDVKGFSLKYKCNFGPNWIW